MENEFKKYTNEELVDTFLNFWDENDAISALLELSNRNHPRTEEFCLVVFERHEFDEYDKGLGFYFYYSFNENNAIDYAKNNYKSWHIITLGKLVSRLWVDSLQENSPKKKELIKLVKNHLKTFKRDEIAEIQEDYDEFMKAYKNV